jgi:predicted dehydrogenase
MTLRILIVGTGGMARNHASAFSNLPGVSVVGGVDVDAKRAAAFTSRYNIPNAFGSLDEALAWGEFDAAANVTPDKAHYPTTMKLLAARKHVFCEKPLAEDFPKAREMADAAEKTGLVAMVNLTYRNVAQLQAARQLVQSGAIGTVCHVEASYLQSWLVSKAWGDWQTESQWLWRLSKAHGSNGCLGDTGIHILDFAVYGADTEVNDVFCRMKAFDKAAGNRIGEYNLDANDGFTMSVTFANGAIGVIHGTRWATGHLNDLSLRVYGSKGGIEVIHTPKHSSLRVCDGAGVERGNWTDVDVPGVENNFQRFVAAVRAGKTQEPSFRHAANLQKVLDAAFVSDQRRVELGMNSVVS